MRKRSASHSARSHLKEKQSFAKKNRIALRPVDAGKVDLVAGAVLPKVDPDQARAANHRVDSRVVANQAAVSLVVAPQEAVKAEVLRVVSLPVVAAGEVADRTHAVGAADDGIKSRRLTTLLARKKRSN